jgi:hypothetical protein
MVREGKTSAAHFGSAHVGRRWKGVTTKRTTKVGGEGGTCSFFLSSRDKDVNMIISQF